MMLSEVPFAAKVRAPDDVLFSELEGESVLLNLQSECYFGLDEVGTRMWQLLVGSDSVQIAYDALLAEFEVEPETLRQHLSELTNSLVQQGLLEVVSP